MCIIDSALLVREYKHKVKISTWHGFVFYSYIPQVQFRLSQIWVHICVYMYVHSAVGILSHKKMLPASCSPTIYEYDYIAAILFSKLKKNSLLVICVKTMSALGTLLQSRVL